ncbi:hypothetical protein RDABS01_018043 [Bienertia sinuspersici]
MFSDTAIQLQPVFAQWIQNTHALAPNATAPGATTSTSLTWGGGDLVAVGGKLALLPIPLGIADFLVHHIHAFTIHVTVLILLKGVLFARSSHLIPDKANLGFCFPCDGPGRGGTCQVSARDHVILGLFWMYNTISVVIFHFSWKDGIKLFTKDFGVILWLFKEPFPHYVRYQKNVFCLQKITLSIYGNVIFLYGLNQEEYTSVDLQTILLIYGFSFQCATQFFSNTDLKMSFLTIGPGDFLVHHAIALGLHTTTLILVKGALDARGSKLMPDKKDFGYSFPCDGPQRGGTCDISAWDAFYLAVFWMLNTIGWVTFYWHWKHITLWQGNVSQFNESSTYLMGWLRDYLWLNSSQLINGYNPFGMNILSVWAWVFLFGHLVWATEFMFLISWRGYWKELIETLAWAHECTPLANLIRWRDKPVALSIVQARLFGLAHFSVGYIFTYATFLIASTSGKFG